MTTLMPLIFLQMERWDLLQRTAIIALHSVNLGEYNTEDLAIEIRIVNKHTGEPIDE